MYNVESIDDLDNFITNNNNNVLLLYFGASWCGPCKLLKEKLSNEEIINQMQHLKVCYIDIDINEDIACMYKVKTLPTQVFVKLYDSKVKIFSRIEGYDYTKLLLEYNKYYESEKN
jgi:thiol-disulfide isomerase/thioredoxin